MNSSRQRPVRFEKIFSILILSFVFTNNFKYVRVFYLITLQILEILKQNEKDKA
jgi:hypothetical protein